MYDSNHIVYLDQGFVFASGKANWLNVLDIPTLNSVVSLLMAFFIDAGLQSFRQICIEKNHAILVFCMEVIGVIKMLFT